MDVTIKKAVVADAVFVGPLFNAYRMFYGQKSNLAAAEKFITARLQNNESVVFLAEDSNRLVGFTQLYPIFSSVGLTSALLLNDLFVTEGQRGKGIATALLDAAKEYGRQANCGWLMLQTAVTNHLAQKVYEGNGWTKDEDFFVYTFNLAQ